MHRQSACQRALCRFAVRAMNRPFCLTARYLTIIYYSTIVLIDQIHHLPLKLHYTLGFRALGADYMPLVLRVLLSTGSQDEAYGSSSDL